MGWVVGKAVGKGLDGGNVGWLVGNAVTGALDGGNVGWLDGNAVTGVSVISVADETVADMEGSVGYGVAGASVGHLVTGALYFVATQSKATIVSWLVVSRDKGQGRKWPQQTQHRAYHVGLPIVGGKVGFAVVGVLVGFSVVGALVGFSVGCTPKSVVSETSHGRDQANSPSSSSSSSSLLLFSFLFSFLSFWLLFMFTLLLLLFRW
jgi:hypothetical protein